MNGIRRRGSAIRVLLAALALVLGIGMGVAGPATTAQAGGGTITICLPIFNSSGQIIGWDCHDFPLEVEEDPICWYCPWAFSFDHVVLPADPSYMVDVLDGLRVLEQAAMNPDQAQRLRSAAQAEFLAAAEGLGEARIRLAEVGIANLERNTIEPDPQPWLAAAGTDVGNGLTLMQAALANPDPTPWLDAAMAEFEEAYQEIAQQQPVGR